MIGYAELMAASWKTRLTRYRLRTLFVLVTVIALALAIPKWIRDWQVRQHEPIRQLVAEHHFRGNPQVIRKNDGTLVLSDVLGDRYALAVTVQSVGFFTAEATGDWSSVDEMGASWNGIRYLLQRKNGQWSLEETSPMYVGCGAVSGVSIDRWARLTHLCESLQSDDAASRRDACRALSTLAWEAHFTNKPQIDVALSELKRLRDDPDPEIRALAEQGLNAAGR